MATRTFDDLVRVTVTLPRELVEAVDAHAQRIPKVDGKPSRSAALRDLIDLGLDTVGE